MIEIDTIFPAVLVKKESYGAFFVYYKQKIFVDILDTSWYLGVNLLESMNIGDNVQVRIIGYNYVEGYYVGSIKSVSPENPYRELSRFSPNTVFLGTVFEKVHNRDRKDGIKVQLPNGAVGILHPRCIPNDIKQGQTIDVIIYSLYIESNHASLSLETPEKCSRKLFSNKKYVTKNEDFQVVKSLIIPESGVFVHDL